MTSLHVDGVEVPLAEDVSIPTSYLIADVRDPSKRDSNRSLQVDLPSNRIIDEVFEFALDPKVTLQTFNPNIKVPVQYKKNGVTVLNGNLKLNKVRLNRESGEAFYNCEIKGMLQDLFASIGESYLTDLDFTAYNHTLSKTNVENSWSATPGTGYVYPLADYGYALSGANSSDQLTFYVHQLRGAFFAYEYLTKIFEAAGKTFSSTWLNDTFFKNLIIVGGQPVTLIDTEYANRTFMAGRTTTKTHTHSLLYTSSWNSTLNTDVMEFNNESTAPFVDVGGSWDNVLFETDIQKTGDYILSSTIDFNTTCSHSGTGVNFNGNSDYELRIQIWAGSSWVQIATSGVLTQSGNAQFQGQLTATYTGAFGITDRVRVALYSVISVTITNSGGTPQTTGTASYSVNIQPKGAPYYSGSFVQLTLQNEYVLEGDTVLGANLIPQNIKQKDFLKGIINMFHLYVLEDKDNRDNYFIEPRPSFFSSNVQNWTSKIDATKDVEIEMIDFSKFYTFSYKEDSDYFNKKYKDEWKEVYGFKRYEAQTEFNNDENKTEIIFSPTPLVGNDVNGLRYPAIYKNENSVVSPTKFNIRILQWGGLIPVQPGSWNFKSNSGDDERTEYPYAGHWDNPYDPTMDLCFDNPREVYFTEYPEVPVCDTNLGSEYHDEYLDQLSHKDSRMIKCRVKLDEIDIKDFDFRDKKYIDGIACVVNAIKDFDPSNTETTNCEFLKLAT